MIALNGHPFQPAALNDYLTQAQAALTPGAHGVVTFGVDNDGQRVAIIFGNEAGTLKFGFAVAHDTSGHLSYGGSGSFSF